MDDKWLILWIILLVVYVVIICYDYYLLSKVNFSDDPNKDKEGEVLFGCIVLVPILNLAPIWWYFHHKPKDNK